jgi:hypothetical protein
MYIRPGSEKTENIEEDNLERGKEKNEQGRNTCSLETTWTGPMFTDTYLPLADTLCFTLPCKQYVNIIER